MFGVWRKMKPWDTPTSVTTVMVDGRTQDQIRKEIRARIYWVPTKGPNSNLTIIPQGSYSHSHLLEAETEAQRSDLLKAITAGKEWRLGSKTWLIHLASSSLDFY